MRNTEGVTMEQWNIESTALPAGEGRRLCLFLDDREMSYSEVLNHWLDSASFRTCFT